MTIIKSISECVAYMTISLNSRYNVKLIQVYVPIIEHEDETLEKLIEVALIDSYYHYTSITVDFNEK